MKASLAKALALIISVLLATGDPNSHGLRASTVGSQSINSEPMPGGPPAPMQAIVPTTVECKSIITQSSSQAVTAGASQCYISHPPPGGPITAPVSYWRAFDMATFSGSRQYFVSSVSFGVNSAADAQSVTIRLYTNNGGTFPQGTRTQIASTVVGLASVQSGTVVSAPLLAVVPEGTHQLVMEVFSPGSTSVFFLGGNTAPEAGSSYWSSGCSGSTPSTIGTHIVFNVYGSCAPGSRR